MFGYRLKFAGGQKLIYKFSYVYGRILGDEIGLALNAARVLEQLSKCLQVGFCRIVNINAINKLGGISD